jgi:hypothetical protein
MQSVTNQDLKEKKTRLNDSDLHPGSARFKFSYDTIYHD